MYTTSLVEEKIRFQNSKFPNMTPGKMLADYSDIFGNKGIAQPELGQ